MTTEEKFNAAVNVIRSLPKNGSYQPSNDLMLRFYSYFKQATQGPCTGSRPGFWDLVGRAKYDAWKSLGDMSKTQAMKKYVDELHSIIETMSYSDKVASFLEEAPQNEIDNFPMDELQLIAGDVIDKVRSDPNSPFNSRGPSPVNLNSYENSLSSTSINLDESSDDEYIDTIEAEDPKAIHKIVARNVGNKAKSKHTQSSSVDISQELNKVVQSLQADIQRLTEKINKIEAKKRTVDTPKTLSTPLLAFLIIWPFVCTLVFNGLRRNKA